jgi:PAS domain S-box-containing protein
LTPEDLIGKTMAEVLARGVVIDSEEMALRAIATGQPIRDLIFAPDHLPGREFLGNMIPINGAGGEIAGVISIVQEITEIRVAENELRRLFSVLDSLPGIVAIYDPDDRLIYTNGAVYPAFDEARRTSFIGLTFAEAMREVVKAGLITDAVGREEAWLEARIAAHRDPKEPIVYHRHDGVTFLIYEQRLEDGSTATIGHDITDAKAAREAWQASEALYRDLVEGSLQGILVHRDLIPIYANEAFIRMFGYESLEDILQVKSIRDLVHQDDVERVISRAKRRSTGEDVSSFTEVRGRRKDGKNVWILTSGRGIQWQGQAAIQATAIDISDRKQAELANEQSETRFRAFFENAQTGNIVIDSAGLVADFNAAATTIFGYRADEVIGRNVSMLMPSQDGQRHDEYLKRYLATGQGRIIGIGREVLGRRKNGEEIPIHLAIGEFNVGSERTFVGSIIDLTETKKLESQLQQAQKMEAVGQLTGGIAHDFNNLLGIIKGNLELAQRRLPSDDRSMLYLADGVDAVDRAAALTHRLLAFARQQPLQQRPSNLADIISGMEDLLRRTISENIGLDVVLEAGGGTVLIDPRQLENALLNLVLNARDAMPNGGNLRIETSTVSITGTEPDLEAEVEPGLYQVISVRDSGVGMPQDDLRKAFDPFFTTKPFGMGSGLGLSMLHGFVRQSGGHVAMESEVGLGTVVRMYLPSSETPMGSTAVSQHQPDGQFPVGRGRTVLVVEDDSELRNIAAEVMQSFEFEVLKAQDARSSGAPPNPVPCSLIITPFRGPHRKTPPIQAIPGC